MIMPLRCVLVVLFSATVLHPADSFSPLTYHPPIEPMAVDGDRCGLQLYVAPNGDDQATGRGRQPGHDGPFATLERARDEIRRLKASGALPHGGVAVNLGAGVYQRLTSFELTADDSGTAEAPIVYRAISGGIPRIIGGRTIPWSAFQPISDPAIIARIDPSAVGKVLALDLKAQHITHTGPIPAVFSDGGGLLEMFVDGQRMPLSRWPDVGETTMQEVVANGSNTVPGSFIYRDDRPARWNVAAGIWLKGQWRVGWEDPAIRVATIDTAHKVITFAAGINGGIGNKYKRPKGSGTEPWHALNLLEEITRPGEWCIDVTSQTLFFWPPEHSANADLVITQTDQPIISAKKLSHVAFIGLSIDTSLGDGVAIANGTSLLIAGCTLRNLAGRAVVLDGTKCTVQSCDMFGIGRGCIIASGGDREHLIASGNAIINNHLHHYGVLKAQYSAAIDLYSDNKNAPAVGMLIAHNLIHHAPRDALLVAGQKNVFEYNEIHRCAYDTADTGAFYSWSDWTIRGLVIRYNYIHDTVGGVNPDDGASGSFVYGNIFSGGRVGVWIASGPDHVVSRNIFIKDEGPVFGIDDRGGPRGYATNQRMISRVRAINPTAPPWSQEFPEMANLLESHPELPLRTQFTDNLIWLKSGEPVKVAMKKPQAEDQGLLRQHGNVVTRTDPGFVDAASSNYGLTKTAPILKIFPDFPQTPMERMGLQLDRYRTRLPTAEDAGRLPNQDPWKKGDTNRNFGT